MQVAPALARSQFAVFESSDVHIFMNAHLAAVGLYRKSVTFYMPGRGESLKGLQSLQGRLQTEVSHLCFSHTENSCGQAKAST